MLDWLNWATGPPAAGMAGPHSLTLKEHNEMKRPHKHLAAISPRALQFWGNKNPELAEAVAMFARAGDLLNHRRAIVRQMQIDNITKPQKRKSK